MNKNNSFIYKFLYMMACSLLIISIVSAAPTSHFFMTSKTNSSIPLYGAPDTVNGYALGGSYYGGGTQYPAYTSGVSGGTYNGSTVSTKSHLIEALTQAASGIGGAVIYISPSANIDMNDTFDLVIPANTTLASNRGVSGSSGGRIYTKWCATTPWHGQLFETGGSNVRITGLRLEGETYPEDYEPVDEEGQLYRLGLTIYDTNCTIDNNEWWGFAYADILVIDVPTAGRPYIHHNVFNGSQNRHEGYGIELAGDSDALVEGNIFDRNRHHITGGGADNEKYTFRYNRILNTSYQIVGMAHVDIHGQNPDENKSGLRYDIYSNTFGGNSSGVHQRGQPVGTYIHNNIFHNVADDAGWTSGNVPVYQSTPYVAQWGNIFTYDNYWQGEYYKNETGVTWYQATVEWG